LPLVGLELAGQQLQQGRLAGAVGPTTPIRSPRWMRKVKSRMIGRSPKRFRHMLGVDHRLRADVVLGQRELRGAGRAEHRRALRAHLVQLGQPALVAPAPRGDAALQPVQLELQLGVELLGRARFLVIDRSVQASNPPKPISARRSWPRSSQMQSASAASGRCGRG
jgi:hypothetical protein